MQVNAVLAETAMGRMLVAATERGICCLKLGEPDAVMLEELRREFPQAEVCATDELDRYVAEVQTYLAGAELPAGLPLDVAGTAFQMRVWMYLRTIPAGETWTYARLAAEMGLPQTAARAVGSACGRNRVALLIPCHRVVRGDGGLGGYRWGLERKRELLRMEGRAMEDYPARLFA